MKSKKLLAAAMLLGGAMSVNAQLVQSTTETGLGLENGAYMNVTTNGVFVGNRAGRLTTAGNNTFVGHEAGSWSASTGNGNNCFFGASAGKQITTGESNVFAGSSAGANNTTGSYNIAIGTLAGANTTNGNTNVFIGHGAGSTNVNSSANVYLGFVAGSQNTGGGNIFIGSGAGSNTTNVNDKLYIDNSGDVNPAIYGDLSSNKIAIGGFTPLTTSDGFPTLAGSASVSAYKLFVKGGILTEAVRVSLSTGGGWADYVFNKDYKLRSLDEVEQYISKNGHLPNVPSAKQVAEDGINVAEMATIQQEKIEELTLYLIEQSKQIKELQVQLKQQNEEINKLKTTTKQ